MASGVWNDPPVMRATADETDGHNEQFNTELKKVLVVQQGLATSLNTPITGRTVSDKLDQCHTAGLKLHAAVSDVINALRTAASRIDGKDAELNSTVNAAGGGGVNISAL
ncbi:hypothetical protein V7968_31715 [Nocardia vulneris]|uniref:Uncharacterized protein n=1 Tax=Nocardia brasiliensis (strain ATCC 700358 / HUJEG-1) TaxID=1133849 RepID=K0ESD3_NOCB7|nr:hypothetical protein [Nocardia brasiliensis]AFU02713.1 hypothetical protein O3I_023790 [Nocardia brasiliensis ATCC 700358]OCF85609.1 hypothetical protein AW168_35715 [Nocardia brasiliensis]